MKREIKLRAWDKSENQMSYSDMEFFDDMIGFRFKHWGIDVDTIDDIEIMQFTGLLDKNGKEIYEGDIVLICSFNDEKNLYEVIIKDIRHLPEEFYGSNFTWSEIIGNIYENPELIKTE